MWYHGARFVPTLCYLKVGSRVQTYLLNSIKFAGDLYRGDIQSYVGEVRRHPRECSVEHGGDNQISERLPGLARLFAEIDEGKQKKRVALAKHSSWAQASRTRVSASCLR